MLRANYKLLFRFENDRIAIVEIKKNNSLSQDPAKVYQWLLYDKINDMLTKLDFKSMNKEKDFEIRTFDDASLKFDSKSAIFSEKGKDHTLKVIPIEQSLSPILKDAISDLLLLDNFRNESI